MERITSSVYHVLCYPLGGCRMPLMMKKKMDIGTGGQVIDLAQVMSDHRVVDVINGSRAIFFCTILNTFV